MAGPDIQYDPNVEEPLLLGSLRNYWLAQRGSDAMPRRADISPSDMRGYLGNILLADVVDGGMDFRYRLVGGELQRYFRGNPTGKLMSEALLPFGRETATRTIHTYASAMARRAPLRVRGSGAFFGQDAKLFDALLTPLSDDGATVNMILATFLFEWDFQSKRAVPGLVEPDEVALARVLCAAK